MFSSVLPVNRFFVMKLVLGSMLGSTILSSFVPVAESLLRLPEFAEPIKNATLTEGSDVEFSCDVRYLGTYRVAWSWRKDEEQRLIGIGNVKITHNTRIHISRIQKSDDVTQFNLYIYNLKKEDQGVYHCSVNSNPMIEQIGILDIVSNGNYDRREEDQSTNETHLTIPILYSNHTNDTNSTLGTDSGGDLEEADEDSSNSSEATSGAGIKIFGRNSTILCIDLNDVWDSARERFSDFFSSLMKFTYSYWFS